jgi:hypothetical protein
MFAAVSHLLIGLIGTVLLYLALFLHETEEGKIQNRLEKLWVDIDDLSKAALSRQAAFLQRVSGMANSALNKLFGAQLISAAAVAASLCLSVASFCFMYLGRSRFFGFEEDPSDAYYLGIGIISLLVGLLPVPWRFLVFPWVFILTVSIFYLGGWRISSVYDSLQFFAVLIGGFLSDVLFIALSRWCLRKGSELKNGWQIVSLVTLNACIGLVLIGPLLLDTLLTIKKSRIVGWIYDTLVFVSASNGVTGAISLLFVLLALVALAHLFVWPLLERPMYSLQRFGVARNPKLLAAASVMCLVFAWPHSPLIQVITKLVHG